MIKISTSILNAKNRIESIQKLNNTNTDFLHIDVMDNKFVPNYQFPINEINDLKKYSKIPLDIHLMVENPNEYLDKLNTAETEYITIHIEINQNIKELINKIKNMGCKVGLAIKPNTKITEIINYIDDIDLILIMSVEPGFGGQKFIPESLNKLKEIRQINKKITIEIDGGINDTNIVVIKEYADIAVIGSYITNNNDYNKAINNLKK